MYDCLVAYSFCMPKNSVGGCPELHLCMLSRCSTSTVDVVPFQILYFALVSNACYTVSHVVRFRRVVLTACCTCSERFAPRCSVYRSKRLQEGHSTLRAAVSSTVSTATSNVVTKRQQEKGAISSMAPPQPRESRKRKGTPHPKRVRLYCGL